MTIQYVYCARCGDPVTEGGPGSCRCDTPGFVCAGFEDCESLVDEEDGVCADCRSREPVGGCPGLRRLLPDGLPMTKPRKRKPGRPRGTTRGGSHVVSIRVNDAQRAELEAEGPSAPAALKRRAFPEPDGASETKETQ